VDKWTAAPAAATHNRLNHRTEREIARNLLLVPESHVRLFIFIYSCKNVNKVDRVVDTVVVRTIVYGHML